MEDKNDVQAILLAYFLGSLEDPAPGINPTTRSGKVVKGDILQIRGEMAESGLVVVFSGTSYKDNLRWTKKG